MLGNAISEFANGGSCFTHTDDLIAPRNEFSYTVIFGELLVPFQTGRRFVFLEPFRNIGIKDVQDRANGIR
jgi:hypothetical protein